MSFMCNVSHMYTHLPQCGFQNGHLPGPHHHQGGSDKVTRSCDENVDESAILRIPSFSVELTLVYFYSLCSCLVFSVYR